MFNCRLLRPAVIGLICHRARLAGRQEEAGVRGVTPPIDDDHTGAPAKQAAGPVLLLWSLGILLLLTQFQGNNITALIELTVDGSMKQTGIFPLEHTTALCLYLSIFWPQCCVDCTESLLRLIWQLVGLFWLDDETSLPTNATHRCSVSEMSQCRALQEHN